MMKPRTAMLRSLLWPLLACAVLLAALALPGQAQAITVPAPPPEFTCRHAEEASFTVRITSCVRQMMWQSVKAYLQAIWPFMERIMMLCLILAMTFHGFKLSANMLRDPWPETFKFFFKIGVLALLMINHDTLYDYPYRIMDHVLFIATSAMPFDHPGMVEGMLGSDPVSCAALDGADGDALLLWKRFDCMFGMILGFSGTMGIGLIPLIIVVILTGVGMALIWPVINFIIFMIEIAFKSVLVYVTALLHISVLLMILPLILPTILFKTTYDIFSKWMAELFDSMVQPIFIFTFLSFMLILLREALNTLIVDLQAGLERAAVAVSTASNGAFNYSCSTPVIGVADDSACQGAAGCTGQVAQNAVQANMCLHPNLVHDPNFFATLLIDLIVLMMIAYLITLFFTHLGAMASRLIRITGANYFSFISSLGGVGSPNYAAIARERQRDQQLRQAQQQGRS